MNVRVTIKIMPEYVNPEFVWEVMIKRGCMRSQEGLHVLFELLEIFVTFTVYFVVTLKGIFMVLCRRSLCRLLGTLFLVPLLGVKGGRILHRCVLHKDADGLHA